MKQLGGFIYPVSKVGRGTTFKIFLPAWTGVVDEAAPESMLDTPMAAPVAEVPSASRNGGDLAGRGVGLIAVTRTSFASGFSGSEARYSSDTLAL